MSDGADLFPVFLHNAEDPNEEETYPVSFWTSVAPRVGDKVYYWIDYPTHMPIDQLEMPFDEGEPISVEGEVVEVVIEFRDMRYARRNCKTQVSVTLKDYKVKKPEDKK